MFITPPPPNFKIHRENPAKTNDWVFDFGDYEGSTLEDVADEHPDFICWCLDNVDGFTMQDTALVRYCRQCADTDHLLRDYW